MVTGADQGCDNFGINPQPSKNGVAGGIVANTDRGSPWVNIKGQHGNQDVGGSTNSENISIGVKRCESRYKTILRKPPDAVRDIVT
jgi:hypothetical protein